MHKYALRVLPAETWLTVYRRLRVENLTYLTSEINFKHQILIPEPSEMVREDKNITSGEF